MYSKKKNLDKFYTKESVAIKCIKQIRLMDYDLVIEPSAGAGSFSNNIAHKNLVSLDLDPENDSIMKMDWFDYLPIGVHGRVLVIGNPPFGLRNKLSKAFIEHAITFADTIAMILPNVYNKHTLQKIFPEGWRLKKVVQIPENSFEIDGEEYHVPCTFYVFDKSAGVDLMFQESLYQSCADFEWSNKYDADWFVMGASPTTVKEIHEVNANNRGYYIKATGISKKLLKEKFQNTYWEGNSSANGGVSWFTKPELIKAYIGE